MKTIERITVYPIKSLDGINVDKVEITQGGSLRYDREFALVDGDGKFINGKKYFFGLRLLTKTLKTIE